MSETPIISKSLYLSGLQCRKKLWLQEYRPDLASSFSPSRMRLVVQGQEVGALARRRFPDGYLVAVPSYRREEAVDETKVAMEKGNDVLFEPAFLVDGRFARIDVLLVLNDGSSAGIIEVKSTSRVKEEHVPDVAFQREIVQAAGMEVKSCAVMHINTRCVWPDVDSFFSTTEVTAEIDDAAAEVTGFVADFREVLRQPSAPAVSIGTHCTTPYECQFREYCWKNLPSPCVFDIPRMLPETRNGLVEQGYVAVDSIPDDYPLSVHDRAHVAFFKAGRPSIDWKAIEVELRHLTFPLYFLDFESDNPAIPRFEGVHPYEQVPFQYSLHVLRDPAAALAADMSAEAIADASAEAGTEHFEFLHTKPSDPRRALAERLLSDIGETGTIIAYYAPFEIGVIKRLADTFPDLAPRLRALVERFWDLLVIFRRHYHHPGFLGSGSLKSVLPVVVPELSYKELSVRDGTSAQAAWNELLATRDQSAKEKLARNLLAYCRLDTLAMVEIYKRLVKGTSEVQES